MPTFDGCDIDHFILTDENGKQYAWDRLGSAVITDTTMCEGAEDTDGDQIYAHIPEEMNFTMEIQQTHKQNRATVKFFKAVENRAKRRYRTYLRFRERVRRAYLKGMSITDIILMYARSKHCRDMEMTMDDINKIIRTRAEHGLK